MKFGRIPHLDKDISRLVMGVIPLPTDDLPASFALLDAYRAAGGNIIDNSYHYGPGFAVVMKAYYVKHGPDALIRFDKGNHHWYGDDIWRLTKEALDHDLRGNLERQGVSYSDLYLFHRDDPRVPIGDVVQWTNEHIAEGRILAWGGSNWTHGRIAEANEYADKRGLQGMSASSPNFSLAAVNEEMWTGAYTIDEAGRAWYEDTQFPIFAWSAGGGGYFAEVDSDDVRRVYENEANQARRERLKELASQKGFSPTQLSLAWTLNQPMNAFALIGPRTVEQVADNMQAAEIALTQDECRWLENG